MKVSFAEAQDFFKERARKSPDYQAGKPGVPQTLLEQAVVASKHLTASPEWNVFLQRIQVWIDQDRKSLQAMGDAIALPNLTSEQILQGQRHMLVTKAKIEAWEQVISLPKEIIGAAPPKDRTTSQ